MAYLKLEVNALYYNYPRYVEPINQPDERFIGGLLPFLAGVAVTSPLVFFAKNQNQPCCQYPPMPYQPMPSPPMPYYPYPYRPY